MELIFNGMTFYNVDVTPIQDIIIRLGVPFVGVYENLIVSALHSDKRLKEYILTTFNVKASDNLCRDFKKSVNDVIARHNHVLSKENFTQETYFSAAIYAKVNSLPQNTVDALEKRHDTASKERVTNIFNFKVQGLNDLAFEVYQRNKEKGFWDKERNVGELLMLVTSELGEAMEAHRKGRVANLQDFERKKMDFEEAIKDTFEDEISDAIIRLFDLAGGFGIDIEKHVAYKLAYNQTRERLHGKKY